MNGHIDADGIAEYRVGLITGRRAGEIVTHLAACPECASVGDRLVEVSTVLAAVPQLAIPDLVAVRLQAALDAEIAISAEKTSVAPARPRFRFPRLPSIRVLAPAAAAVTLLGGGAYLVSQLGNGSAAMSSSASAAGNAIPSSVSGSLAQRNAAQGNAEAGTDFGVGKDSFAVVSSGTDLRSATLTQQLTALWQARSASHTSMASVMVKACVQAVAADHPVKLVASARYDGAPATVVIIGQGVGYLGLIAGSHCSATNSDIVARVVLPSGISTP
jgi:hypothetical protein